MTKPDQLKLRILILLLVVLAATVYFGKRMSQPANPAVVQAEASKTSAPVVVQSDARIRLETLDKSQPEGGIGRRNLFGYQQPRPPEPPPRPPIPIPPPNPVQTTPQPTRPPGPPPLPPIPLKYLGFAYVEPNSKNLIATISDDSLQKRFYAVEGYVWMGRYRVARITDTMVEVEDLEYNRRQTFPLIKQ